MQTKDLHAIPIANRPTKEGTVFRTVGFFIVFESACFIINGTQFLIAPLYFVSRALYERGMRYCKAAFGLACVLITQLFAPTNVIITCDKEDEDKLAQWVRKDERGNVVELNFPKKLVIMSNHQMYADWLYIWSLTYFMGAHSDVYIILKKSLKWVPIIGWGMQFYRFIFLSRSWASDRLTLTKQLSQLAKRTMQDPNEPMALMIFPEGTLVSEQTQPVSKKYADKLGIANLEHALLPRSTGLHNTLLTLAQIPSLYLLDFTIAYPGVPRDSYPQRHYTLRSIFMSGVPPPAIHLHVNLYKVTSDVPVGEPRAIPNGTHASPLASPIQEPTAEEKAVFEAWLQEKWRKKDALMETFAQTGAYTGVSSSVTLPLRLRTWTDVFDAYCWWSIVLCFIIWKYLY